MNARDWVGEFERFATGIVGNAYLHTISEDRAGDGILTVTVAAIMELDEFGNAPGLYDDSDRLVIAGVASGHSSTGNRERRAAQEDAARKFMEAIEPIAKAILAAKGSR